MKLYSRILAHLFFLFFTCIILSPSIKEQPFYLYWIIPIIDFSFISYLRKIKIKREKILVILSITVILIIYGQFITILRIYLIIYTLVYLKYLDKYNYFYLLYKYMNFNIIVAIFQFIFGYVNPKIAYQIGPTNIAKIIWGEYAGATFTNFYSIGFLKRASGLSREVGFFASLLIIVIIIYCEDRKIKKNKKQYLIFFIGYIIGFSKMSFILPVYFILKKIRKYINIFSLRISSTIITIGLIIISSYLKQSGYFDIKSHETWIHRLGGYYIISKYSLINFIYPLRNIIEIYKEFPIAYLKNILWLKYFTGLSHMILHMGGIVYILFLIILNMYKITTFKYLVLILLCFNTSFITVSSYIILNYYFIFDLGAKDEKKIVKMGK